MPRAGEEERGGSKVRNARGTDRTIGPRLPSNPFRNLAVIFSFGWRAEAVPGSEACAGAADVDDDNRVTSRHEEIAVLRSVGRILATSQRAGFKRKAAVVRGENEDRGHFFSLNRSCRAP